VLPSTNNCGKKNGTLLIADVILTLIVHIEFFLFLARCVCILFYIAGKNAFVIYAATGASLKGKQKKTGMRHKKSLAK